MASLKTVALGQSGEKLPCWCGYPRAEQSSSSGVQDCFGAILPSTWTQLVQGGKWDVMAMQTTGPHLHESSCSSDLGWK